jgi:hypothetical protein
MQKRSDNPPDQEEPAAVYPKASKGALSEDQTGYQKPRRWKGIDPDRHMTAYFIASLVAIGFLFFFAVKAWVGSYGG